MELKISREEFPQILCPRDRTIGGFYINEKLEYFSLEDEDRKLEEGGIKIPKKTAIPRGRYKVTISRSNRFQRRMPEILNVPQFSGIRIHDGGLVAEPIDTEGCPIPGYAYDISNHTLLRSKDAFDNFFVRLDEAVKREEAIWITVK